MSLISIPRSHTRVNLEHSDEEKKFIGYATNYNINSQLFH